MSRDILPVMSGAVGRAEQASGPVGRAEQASGAVRRAEGMSGPVQDKAAQHEPITDEVDQLVQEWRVQRPDLDVAPLHVLSRIWRLARHLDRARASAFAGHGLEPWEFDVLSSLRRQGPPYQLSPGSLLRATMVTSGTMTNRIDRLEASGLVHRRPDPQDKRGVLVSLTDKGLERVDHALADLLSREHALLDGLSQTQREELGFLLRRLLAPFDTESRSRE